MHQMCRLDHQIFDSIRHCTLQCLIHIVDCLSIARLHMIDNDLSGKCSSYRPVRISRLQRIFNTLDVSHAAVIKRSAKAHHQNLIFSNVILTSRVIL